MILALQEVGLKDNGGSQVNPICLAAINFARNYLSTYLPPSGQQVDDGMAGNAQFEILKAVLGSVASFAEVFTGPNQFQFISGVGKNLVANKSYVRLYPGRKDKLGGGCRVKSVKMYDNWSSMSQGGIEKVYGQEYKYELEGGGSSGVAQYEPQIGGEENPFKTPVVYSTKFALAPDKVNYQETPFGESFFPSASVGYSRVEVQSLSNGNVRQNSTGKIVNEFFTAKDFPTRITRSNIIFDPKSDKNKYQSFKQTKHRINLLFFSNNTDKVSVSQGFVVENNDMHGKQKKMTVYGEKLEEGEAIVSSVVYQYALKSPGRLDNKVQVVRPDGRVEQAVRGLNYDAIVDFRESITSGYSGSAELNVNVIPFIIPIPIPLAYASVSREKTEFRSASVTKTINRFGILEKTVAEDLGSIVSTENLAYDSETGSVLLTKTKTNFNDDIYSLKIPAHWMYSGMGQAYKSGLIRFDFSVSVAGGILNYGSSSGFHEGDEILVYSGSTGQRGWLRSVSSNRSYVVNDAGQPLITSGKLVVLRSGRRNMQSADVATIISRTNPLPALRSNQYQQVLQASAIEFENAWRNGCGCETQGDWSSSTNPYYNGEKGRFKPQASYSYLTKRTQTFENGNSNLRDDGFFEGFNPFYKNRNGNWVRDYDNWTFASEIRNINENGMAVETADALFRYTATLYGFNKTLPRAIAVNSRRYEIGAEDFEDLYPGGCTATEFRFTQGTNVVQTESHSGKNAISIPAGGNVSLQRQINFLCPVDTSRNCELTLRVEKYDPPINQFPRTDVEDAFRVYMDKGTPEYSFSGDLIQGELIIEEYNASGGFYNVVFRNGLDTNEYFLTVTDSEGCTQTVRLFSPN